MRVFGILGRSKVAVLLTLVVVLALVVASPAIAKTVKKMVKNTGALTTALERWTNTGGGPALDLVVNAGVAPLTVNSSTKVTNLNADQVDGTNFTFNRTGVVQPNASVDVLDVPNVGKLSAACGTGGDSFTLTYTNQFGDSQQQIADQRSQDSNGVTTGVVLASGGTKNFSFTSDGAANRGHRLFLQVAPSAQTSPNTVALTTFDVTALTQAGGQNTCRFQGSATVH